MEAQPTPGPPQVPIVYPPRRWPWVVAGAAAVLALAGAAFLVWYFAIRDTSSSTVHGPPQAPFTLDIPQGWTSLTPDQLLTLPGNPLGVVKKDDQSGVIIVNSQPATSASLDQLSKQVETQLKHRIPDFKLVGTSTADLPAGHAISISYTRTEKGTSNIVVAVPAGGRIYTLNAIIRPGSSSTAQQVGQIINSFDA